MRAMLRSVFLAALLFCLMPSATHLDAQEPGDVYWQLVPNGFMSDERIQQALLLLTDTEGIAAEAGLEGSLLYSSARGAEIISQADREDVKLLFAAAGFDDPAQQLTQTRPCRIWTADDAQAPEDLAKVAAALGEALSAAWGQVGVEVEPCRVWASREDADVLVWEFGQDYAIVEGAYDIQADSFIDANLDRPGAVPGGSTGGDVSPPTTGDAGLR